MKSKLAGVGASKAVIGASLALLLCGLGTTARADVIPYQPGPNPDPNTDVYNFTAVATGEIIAYFVGSTAKSGAVYDLGLQVNGTLTPKGFGLPTCPACPTPPLFPLASLGESFDLGHANAGDALTFVMRWNGVDSVPPAISSNPALNADGTQHVYSTPYTATSEINVGNGPIAIGSIPAGTFVSFEDQPFPSLNIPDYNDFDFVVTNVSPNSVPGPIVGAGLPGLILACGALLALARRRRQLVV